jgi:hypothetical protein
MFAINKFYIDWLIFSLLKSDMTFLREIWVYSMVVAGQLHNQRDVLLLRTIGSFSEMLSLSYAGQF